MKHVIALLIKFGFVSLVLLSTLTFFEVAISWILFAAFIAVIPAYVIGDLLIYPRYGNFIASLADLGLYSIVLWLLNVTVMDGIVPTLGFALLAAFFISFLEAIYHEFVLVKAFNMKKGTMFSPPQFSTEFAEDMDVTEELKKKKKD
ncbi:YndM family protein [Evansella cellulosilytica]|uniref:DUF2512 family protein n=1 Tax=Evansella cellulosilytica (strain ATCC 21833 / DSM 2522 / FERM P-1141 / JCM 9156 / N-4) TaxID=649639 RepID=E6U1D2_EVAC2|nr:YndM family protein [Evansella cellulosilytica]ADU29179.1 Protein of unknown function DUF2512 [Evansella cellulosilytica DSM 2522]